MRVVPPHRDQSQPNDATSRRATLFGAVASALFLLPHIAALVHPYEEFPYTSAPMFAHYVGPETPRYRFRFAAEFADGRPAVEFRGPDLGLRGVEFTRYFFSTVYGSVHPHSPFAPHRQDTPAAFEARMTRALADMATVLRRRDPARWQGLAGVRLEVVRLGAGNREVDAHEVGVFSLDSGRFVHTWRSAT
jgi:hypothetical protein